MELLMEYDLVLGQWHLIGKAHGRANESTDYMICLLAHGVVSRVCFGAWPMAFDWERPWKFLPAVCVFGSSWIDWHKIFARTKANEFTYYMICLLAHGVVNGVWFGAWPMEFDWESPWQECYLIAKDSRANESTDYMICLLPHGVVSGVCFGAWPMAFDWESPWKVCYLIAKDSRANDFTDFMICLLAYGVVSGVWFGAWPMTFDWESPWQISIIHPYRRHTSAGNMFVLFSNVRACLRSCIGGGVPESKRANELGRLLDVNILPLQVIQGHTPFKQLMRRFENEIVVVVGKGGPTEVMSEYGFKYTH
ncbi:putative mitogen-activated protein kinase kinase kinase A-like [Capsicum annuum]|nr:putative mitogen-activated protein kinase kinase kinase A-like [Capsicum annuum]